MVDGKEKVNVVLPIVKKIKSAIPEKQKKTIKKLLGRNLTIYKGKNLRQEALTFEKNFHRDTERTIVTDILQEETLSIKTRAMDCVIEKKLKSGIFTFDYLLVICNPYGLSPLSALALFYTPKSCKVRCTVKGISEIDNMTGVTSKEQYHRVPIFGLYPNEKNEVCLELLDKEDKIIESKTIVITTGKLPRVLSQAVELKKHSCASAIPFTLIAGKNTPYPFVFDNAGNIRFYLSYRPYFYGLFPLSNGRFMFMDREVLLPTYQLPHSTQMYEMDYFGRVHKTYFVEKGCHHDVFEMTPGGNLLLVSNSLEGHLQDAISEIDRDTGAVIKTLDLREIFGTVYRDSSNWAHINTVSYEKETNTVLICPRNLHSAIKVDWKTNELLWILGPPEFWENTPLEKKVLQPTEEFPWHYQPHAVYELPYDLDNNKDTKHIILFDNHWHKRRRVKFFDNDLKSYVKIYTINPKEMTVKLERAYEGVKSKITSNAFLDYEKKRVFFMGAYLEPLIENRGGMIYEYDFDTAEVLNQYSLRYYFYRAYPFALDYKELGKKMKLEDNFVVGNLSKIIATEKPKDLSLKDLPVDTNIKMRVSGQVLYIEGYDHQLQQIYFVGKQNTFFKDFTKTKQERADFAELVYEIAIPLWDLEQDAYEVYLNLEAVWYDTKKKLTVL